MRVFIALSALALMAGAALPAAAQPASLQSLAGEWAVETSPHSITGCVIHGRATARLAENGRALDISLNVDESCPDGLDWQASESCVGMFKDAHVTVRCTLVSASSPDYRADHFFLTAVTPTAMSGRLIDGGAWNEPVQWRRPTPALVS